MNFLFMEIFHKVKKKIMGNQAFGGQKMPQTQRKINLYWELHQVFFAFTLVTSCYFDCFHVVFRASGAVITSFALLNWGAVGGWGGGDCCSLFVAV